MTNTVILAGAGATLAEALPSRPPKGQLPPLDATFFDLCRDADLGGFHTVHEYMSKHYGMDLVRKPPRMEEVFNYIYSDSHGHRSSDESLQTYWFLLRMYSDALARTTNQLDGMSRYGVGALLRHLWVRDRGRVFTFITFNHDLVIEKAIQNTVELKKYTAVPWNVRVAYKLDFKAWHTLRGTSRPLSTQGSESITILKMHGSLNWIYRVRSGLDPKNSLRSPRGQLTCLNDAHITLGLRQYSGKKWTELIPLVVPPIYEKASLYQRTLEPIWSAAFQSLVGADEIFIFGYSLPDADVSARSLLRRAIHENPELPNVIVIDTEPSVGAKVASILGLDSLEYYSSVSALVSWFS